MGAGSFVLACWSPGQVRKEAAKSISLSTGMQLVSTRLIVSIFLMNREFLIIFSFVFDFAVIF